MAQFASVLAVFAVDSVVGFESAVEFVFVVFVLVLAYECLLSVFRVSLYLIHCLQCHCPRIF